MFFGTMLINSTKVLEVFLLFLTISVLLGLILFQFKMFVNFEECSGTERLRGLVIIWRE